MSDLDLIYGIVKKFNQKGSGHYSVADFEKTVGEIQRTNSDPKVAHDEILKTLRRVELYEYANQKGIRYSAQRGEDGLFVMPSKDEMVKIIQGREAMDRYQEVSSVPSPRPPVFTTTKITQPEEAEKQPLPADLLPRNFGQLRKFAKDNGVTVDTTDKKADILRKLAENGVIAA